MLKFIYFIALLALLNSCWAQTSASPLTDEQKKKAKLCQTILDGLFEANSLPRPTTVLNCVDISVIETIYDLINPISVPKAFQLMMIFKDLYLNNPCSKSNPEVLNLYKAVGVSGGIDFNLIISHVSQNIPYFLAAVPKFNSLYQEGDFIKYGKELSLFIHEVFDKSGVKANPPPEGPPK